MSFLDVKVLFEDRDIIVCIKPCGVLSQSDEQGRENMVSILTELTGGNIYPLHRLDREVGGVMVFAKSKRAAAALSRDIAENRFKKEYIALVHNLPSENKGSMRDLLFKDSRKNKSFVVNSMRKGVKEALLDFEVLKTTTIQSEQYSIVKVLLHTGRTHQIRVQFAFRKMMLAGDKKYGARDSFESIGLWSFGICFNHPISQEKLCFEEKPQNIIKEYI